jgi:hypothetical protein
MSKMTLNQKRNFVNSLGRWTPIKVVWNDAFSKRGWFEIKELPRLALQVINVGLYVSSCSTYLYIANGHHNEEEVTDLWGVPFGMITSIKVI